VNGGVYTVVIRYQTSGTATINAVDFAGSSSIIPTPPFPNVFCKGFPVSISNGNEFIILKIVCDTTFGSSSQPYYYVSAEKFG
jgi:hypothetical protein